jgi:hypothetical protein
VAIQSVTILFPPSRTRIKGILKLGFQPDGEVMYGEERFIRYRLLAPDRMVEKRLLCGRHHLVRPKRHAIDALYHPSFRWDLLGREADDLG